MGWINYVPLPAPRRPDQVQGYLAKKKPLHLRTLQYDYA